MGDGSPQRVGEREKIRQVPKSTKTPQETLIRAIAGRGQSAVARFAESFVRCVKILRRRTN
jgi:hypothetical protein